MTRVYRGQRLMLVIFLYCFLPYFFRNGVSEGTWSLLIWLEWLSSKLVQSRSFRSSEGSSEHDQLSSRFQFLMTVYAITTCILESLYKSIYIKVILKTSCSMQIQCVIYLNVKRNQTSVLKIENNKFEHSTKLYVVYLLHISFFLLSKNVQE